MVEAILADLAGGLRHKVAEKSFHHSTPKSAGAVYAELGKCGRTHMGSDGFNQVLTGFFLFDLVRVRPAPLENT